MVLSCDLLYDGTGGPAVKWADCVREDWYMYSACDKYTKSETTLNGVNLSFLNRSSWGPNLTKVHVHVSDLYSQYYCTV